MPLADSKVMAFTGTTRPEESRAFYEEALGLELVRDDHVAMLFRSGGTVLRITKLHEHHPQPFTVVGWEVSDIHEVVEDLASRGIEFQHFPGMSQDDRGVATFYTGDQVAWLLDPDRNILSLTQFAT
jgi:catechol 2,3-dioxygenase-like lactoylglutathione lyase family enzyme